ncbi:VWA domain-containing protein [Formosa maritima]|uniref:VWA domain-containing protein n=1 Tax=Formosa maritima TaxID=2592046 RepID=A0A5D0GKU0_9FLAO|nr:VWA domain-containing protein [Formosa maritima]TYA58959.1 VWA domain-containing protein [Formosa maritima]
MQTETILYIILSGIIALFLALFQYRYKVKKKSNLNIFLAFLRFVSIFSLLLLFINPKLESQTIYVEKPNLNIVVDNSNSINYLNQSENALSVLNNLNNNVELAEKFNVNQYAFGNQLNAIDSLNFNEQQTNLDKVFKELNQVYKQTVSPTVLITDGNQTIGNDYYFTASKYSQPIYSVILGDSTIHADLKVQQLNVNKYAYLKNKFPVEAILVYQGEEESIQTTFNISIGNSIIYKENIKFSKDNTSRIINFYLPANQVGIHTYKSTLVPIENERNTINNSKEFAVDVIDQKTNIALVSDFIHPDLGTLKKSIETNEQRQVSILKPNEYISKADEFQLVILYQPNNNFKEVFSIIKTSNVNSFLISGTKTNWSFINSLNLNYIHEVNNQTEDYQAILNSGFSDFIVENLEFESFPPLKSSFGNINFKVPYNSILFKKIGSVSTQSPLLITIDIDNKREAILLGENIWQWRAQSFLNSNSFNQFDNFIGKLVQYLASNKQKSRISLDYESVYEGNSNIVLKAQYFNKNYEFDSNETLTITVTDKVSKETNTFPLILKGNYYQVDLSNLPASEFDFSVKVRSENISKSGSIKILDYNIEQQFLNADYKKLQQVSNNSNGKSFFALNSEKLVANLLEDERYKPIQKSIKNIVPLIDWKYLLLIIILSLSAEWFIRKYNGLI